MHSRIRIGCAVVALLALVCFGQAAQADVDCETLNCDDGIGCTNDTCDPILGCQHVPARDGLRGHEPPVAHLRPAFGGWGIETIPLSDLSTRDILVEEFHFRTYDDVRGAFTTIHGEIWLPRSVERSRKAAGLRRVGRTGAGRGLWSGDRGARRL